MFSFLKIFKASSRIESFLFQYLSHLESSQNSFYKGMKEWMSEDFKPENLKFHAGQTHKYESKADDIRDEINDMMYGKVLIPESRGDIMVLIAKLDNVIHVFERIFSNIQIQRLSVPDFLREDFSNLLDSSLDSCEHLLAQVKKFFKGEAGIREELSLIDYNESKCDLLKRQILKKLFDSDLDPFLKLQHKDLVREIGHISDMSEHIARRVNIISMKRRV